MTLTFAQRQTLKLLRDFAQLRCQWRTAAILRERGFIEPAANGWRITKAGLAALSSSEVKPEPAR